MEYYLFIYAKRFGRSAAKSKTLSFGYNVNTLERLASCYVAAEKIGPELVEDILTYVDLRKREDMSIPANLNEEARKEWTLEVSPAIADALKRSKKRKKKEQQIPLKNLENAS